MNCHVYPDKVGLPVPSGSERPDRLNNGYRSSWPTATEMMGTRVVNKVCSSRLPPPARPYTAASPKALVLARLVQAVYLLAREILVASINHSSSLLLVRLFAALKTK
ncbi:uncharacterized protein MEPE_06241 [Melanopsichium pennsylvanicum]|uniref:Uncharacterized protein n=1 Tax=Melanopsichium pennsylvanicum TaxID=63383 RepID=A0AAJ4XT98_9BASI|nr:uncharacterized protein MEPE_06241 [Melanopsichium pennsylvanicum]